MNYGYAMFFAGMLAMGVFSGLIVLLIIRPWLRPIKRSLEASHEVIIEKSRLQATRVKKLTAQTEEEANQAAITAERSRQEHIRVQAENDQLEEARRRAASRREDADKQMEYIEEAIGVEKARARLRRIQTKNDREESLSKPKNWFVEHRYLTLFLVMVLAIVTIITIRILTK